MHARADEIDKAMELLGDALAQGGDAARTAAAEYPILNDLLGG